MELGLLLSGAVTAGSVGMSCGTCCGSGISAFLSGYLMTHARNFRESFGGFWKFYLGKIAAVAAICLATSMAGSRLLDDQGYIGRIPLVKVVDLCMIGMALWLLYDLWREKSGQRKCAHCNHEGAEKTSGALREKTELQYFDKKMSGSAIFLMGVGYGITPCAPLILIAGYCASLPSLHAAFVGAVFAAASAVSPMLILLLLSGVLAGRMYREIPKYLDLFRAACYCAVIVFFVYSFFTGGSVVA